MPTIHCPKCNQEYEVDESIVGCSVEWICIDKRAASNLWSMWWEGN